MIKAFLTTRFLTNEEISILTGEIRRFPDLTYVGGKSWKKHPAEVVEVNHKMAGILLIYRFGNWVKLGPLAVIKQYQGKGLGKLLIKKAIKDNKGRNLLISSTNQRVEKIAVVQGFSIINRFSKLPLEIKVFLVRHSLEYLGIINVVEAVRKALTMPRGRRKYFIKYSP